MFFSAANAFGETPVINRENITAISIFCGGFDTSWFLRKGVSQTSQSLLFVDYNKKIMITAFRFVVISIILRRMRCESFVPTACCYLFHG